MSKIQKELAEVTGVNLGRGEKATDSVYLKKLIKGVAELSDKDWAKLSKDAQAWYNNAADLSNKKKDIPDFPDAEPEAEDEPAPRRRRSSEDEDVASAKSSKYSPKKGDEVKIVTARDKTITGKVVDPDDKGELVLIVDGEEISYQLDRLKSVEQVGGDDAEERPRRRRAAEDDEAPAKVEPEVGDTVEVETGSGRKKLGIIVEIDSKTLVIKDGSGEEIEYSVPKVANIVVKLKYKEPEPAKTPSRKKADEDDTGDEKPARSAAKDEKDDKPSRATKDENGGVSVTTRARELMCEDYKNPPSLEELTKLVEKEKLTANPSTLKMVHADCLKMFKLLVAAGHLKK